MTGSPAEDSAFVDAVARRVVELIHETENPLPVELLTVAEVARRYRVRPDWVYAHKNELGVIRLGTGPKARLRFDATIVARTLGGELDVRTASADHRPRRRRRRLKSRTPPPLA